VSVAPVRPSRWHALWWPCWLAILTAGVVVKALQTTTYLFGTRDDDELMVRMAKGFLDGHWSSTWASTGPATLAKPVGYPLFLAGAHYLPWSPVLSAYLLYLLGAVLIAWSWRRISGSRPQATIVLVMLTFSPTLIASYDQSVYRDVFVDALATVAIGLAFVIAAESHLRRRGRPAEPVSARVAHRHSSYRPSRFRRCLPFLLALSIGVAIGLAAITKPTYQWLVIAVAAPLAYPVAQRLGPGRFRVASLLKMLLAGLLVVAGVFGVVETTKVQNKQAYHVALVEDFSSGALARVWKLWTGVEAGAPERYVPITRAMRLAVYRVSPTAAQLKPWLESPTDGWKRLDCESAVHICNEAGDWFQWDLRYTAASLGGIHSVAGLQTYLNRIADDIARACADGRLTCSSSPVLATGLPRLDRIPIGAVVTYTTSGLWQMVRDQFSARPLSTGRPTPAQYALWNSVVPAMPPLESLSTGHAAAGDSAGLRPLIIVYGIANLLLLTGLCLGVGAWLGDRLFRRARPRRRPDRQAASSAALFLVATFVGMGTLAIFAAALGGGGYTAYYYWTDFATPGELVLVLGTIAFAPVLRHRVHRGLQGRTDSGVEVEPLPFQVKQLSTSGR
jgi:hypothetical protein